MNAPDPAVLFRRRTGWEAADMGIFLWQINWLPMLLFLGIPAGILTASQYLVPEDTAWLRQLVAAFIWWLKPLLDRFSLHVLSVRFFEPGAPFRRLFRGLGQTIFRGLTGDLLWRRFSPYRSARMPLVVLERLKGKNYRRRKELLVRNGLGFGFSLTLICLGIQTVLQLGELLFLYNIIDMIRPGGADGFLEFLQQESPWVSLLFWINLTLIETLYVSMGFGLYINSRVETEGWDIELLFKRCVKKAPGIFSVVMAALLFFTAVVPGQAAVENPQEIAVELKPAPLTEQDKALLDEVYNSPDFGTKENYRKIQFKKTEEKKYPRRQLRNFDFPQLKKLMGLALRFIAGAALLAGIVFAAVYVYRRRNSFLPRFSGRSSLREETAARPLELLEEAAELHRAGKIREAWALCFRAFTAAFEELRFLSFPPEATEYEALALVRTNTTDISGPASNTAFEVFIRRWINLAYGGKFPEAGNFEEALNSCRSMLTARLP
ncbi:hypothetical protein AGMMS50230_05510 [Spirochaetia bacterium]|nr:hypothetical protein AGMMS50230_05510 [Spirochaetia bacterium]